MPEINRASKRPAAQRKRLIHSLGKAAWVHRLITLFRIYQVANFVLGRWPISIRRPTGTVYRLISVASFALAEEMFASKGCYHQALTGNSIETFVDLGSNAGWFPLLIKELQPGTALTGILIEADPAMVEESVWHLEKNGLAHCLVLLGVVGCPPGQREATFYVNPASTQSSAQPLTSNHPFPLEGKLRPLQIQCLSLAQEWTERFGNRPIDLLKIDIEGAELNFIRNEISFLESTVRQVVCEWHSWHVSLDEIQAYLRDHGFELVVIAEEDEYGGVALFRRTTT